jgi:hypothetical protein
VTPETVGAVALGAVLVTAGVLVGQPRRAWHEAAEHTQAFWVAWALVWAALGLTAVVLAGMTWPGVAVLAAACLIASAQPSMIADIHDVRRLGRLRRRQQWMPSEAPEPTSRTITWRAPLATPSDPAVQTRRA